MLKRTILFIMIITAIINISGNKAYALTSVAPDTNNISVAENAENKEVSDIINKVSFRDKFKKTPETQINTFFKKFAKYSQKNVG